MAPKVERIPEIPNLELGEGPHWDAASQSLFLVDIFGKSVHKYVTSTGQHSKVDFDRQVSVVIPVQGKKNQYVVTLDREVALIHWNGASEKADKIETLFEVDPGMTGNRINDGKCDSKGRLWAGTMGPELEIGHYTMGQGSFFTFDGRKAVKKHFDGVGVSNGLAWNDVLKKFYYVDSLEGNVDAFDYDAETMTISNRTPIFTLSKNGIVGIPDGMTIDRNGNLWLAVFNGSKVVQIDPRKPETLLQTIEFPAKQITSVAWGGVDLDVLYVTSGSFTVNGEVLVPPYNGATYKVTGLGTQGLPMNSFVL